ncbi:hypothetical protein ACH5RR_021687 [Cinchona calisaya]|uniref:Uncharacterized protein n=1 Tax=Cinchona calisaya TaxID=153742 RepID=A0ABD2ZJA6_9GENT
MFNVLPVNLVICLNVFSRIKMVRESIEAFIVRNGEFWNSSYLEPQEAPVGAVQLSTTHEGILWLQEDDDQICIFETCGVIFGLKYLCNPWAFIKMVSMVVLFIIRT